jgi:CubicO group peptidase (beta-lactamase class C family)
MYTSLFALAAALMFSSHAAALPTSATSKVDALMQKYDGNVPGASLLVIKNGVPLIRRGYGMADLEQHTAAKPATDYRLASVSKQFTAASILLLAEDGKLKLDDSIRRWLPSLPASTEKVTLRELLSHTGGLIDYEDLMPANTTEQLNDSDVLRMLSATSKSYFPPGTAYRYSNSGYVLLGLVVEKVSGKSLPAFMHDRIFKLLHMDHTLMYVRGGGPEVSHRAYGYSEENGAWKRTDQDLTSATRGDGGIYSSIDDLAKWDAALYDHRLLSDASRKLAFSPHVKVVGEPYEASYGFGWRITGDTLWHSGESIGFRNVIVRWPKQHLTIILLSNRNDPEPYRTVLAIAEQFLAH